MTAVPAGSTLRLRGEIDMLTADSVGAEGRRLLAAAEPGAPLVVDLGEVTFLDSAGLSALVQLRLDATARGVEVVLRDVPARVSALLRVSGLADLFATD